MTTLSPADALGRFERACSRCGKEWVLTQAECACGSHELTETYREPTLLERGPFGRIRALVTPAKPKPPRADAATVSELRGFQVTIEHCRAEIARIDELLSAAVRDGVDELQPAHGILHAATFTTGDASISDVHHLSLGLRAVSDALSREINNLQETP